MNTSSFVLDDGVWWYAPGRAGWRQRATVLPCATCGKEAVTYPGKRIAYCSKDCWRATCARCGTVFQSTGSNSKFCSTECKVGSRDCPTCGKTFSPKKDARYCSAKCRPNSWQLPYGSRRDQADGYTWIRVERGTPGLYASGWMLEHRLVMAGVLGRPLEDHETIHHINGDRHDNRPENLQLRDGRHGKGVVHECVDCGSRNIRTVHI